MKTKVIYISGGEMFEMSAVRGAMDAVRAQLGLGPDTILFGVPVDADDALATETVTEIKASESVRPTIIEPVEIAETVEKPKKVRKKKELVTETESETVIESEPVVEIPEVTLIKSSPILSVIGAVKSEPVETAAESAPITIVTESVREIISVVESDMDGDEDEIKSIEDIFAGIDPIAEDKPMNLADDSGDDISQISDEDDIIVAHDFDETLSQLATEFVSRDATPVAPVKSARGGKIGKLKNILPFKKKENSEPGVLGDLFGWAGVAANDDVADFTMPEFFRMKN
ncbi:MAG: hypothetical protein FWF34_03210 [Alphaproteobacteria bacterium]|nr:hypothetical protein [Alphaproteobacteria bacterium]MCL2890240.1 hypothetical protein [Alphaproteobacteria bacterium]